jgi:hypothetical protein
MGSCVISRFKNAQRKDRKGKNRGDESIQVIIHIHVEMSQ